MEGRAQTITVTLPDGPPRTVPAGPACGRSPPGSGRAGQGRALGGQDRRSGRGPVRARRARREGGDRHAKWPRPPPLYRHSTAHLTANAVKRFSDESRLTIGPAIERGLYYDFNPERPFTPDDLARHRGPMCRRRETDYPVERLEEV